MNETFVIGIIFTLINIVIGAIVRSWFQAQTRRVSELTKDMQSLRETLPREFVLKADYNRDIQEIRAELKEIRREIHDGFRRLEERLSQKADKA
ncbi:MAG: hypothetical protein GXO39_04770 [Thermotogae bacterium]|nr:hypothetical protein [Thermotogota bacterium]